MSTLIAESRGRRGELLDAAVHVVSAVGLRGLTHRAVDARAGLAQGTCSAYLRTRLALLEALTEHVGGILARDVEEMAARLAPHAHDHDAVVQAATELLLGWLGDVDVVRAQSELALEATRRPELMVVFDRWRQGLVEVVEAMVARSGAPDPARRAAIGVAALEGVLAAASRLPRAERADFVRAAVPVVVLGLREHG